MKRIFLFLLMAFTGTLALAAENNIPYVDNAKLTTLGGNSTIEYTIAGTLDPQAEYLLTVTPQYKTDGQTLENKTVSFKESTLTNRILKLDLPGLSQEEASRYYLGDMKITSNAQNISLPGLPTIPAPNLPMAPLGATNISAKDVTLTLNCFQQQGKIIVTAFAFASDAAKAQRGSFFVQGYRQDDKSNPDYYLYGVNSDRLPVGNTISGEMRTDKGKVPSDGKTYCFDGYFAGGSNDPFVISPAKPVCCKAVSADMAGGRLQPYQKGEAKRPVSISKDKKTSCAKNGICAQVIEESGTAIEVFAAAFESNEPDVVGVECYEDPIGYQGPDYVKNSNSIKKSHSYKAQATDRQNSAYLSLSGLRPGMQYRCFVTFTYGKTFPRFDYGDNFYAKTKKVAAYIEDFCAQTPNQISVLISSFGYAPTANASLEVSGSVLYREKGTQEWKESEIISIPDKKSLIPRYTDKKSYQTEIAKLIAKRTSASHADGENWCYPIGKGQYQITVKNLTPGTLYEFRPKIEVKNGQPDANLEYEPRKVLSDRYKDEFENKNFRSATTFNKIDFQIKEYSKQYNGDPIIFNAQFNNSRKDFLGWFVIGASQSTDKWCTPQQRITKTFNYKYSLPIGLTQLMACDNNNTPTTKSKQFYRMANTDYNVMAYAKYQGLDGKWKNYQSDAQLFSQASPDKSSITDVSAQLDGKKPTVLRIQAKITSKDINAACFFQIKEITGTGTHYYEKNYISKEVKPKNGICSFSLSEYGTPLFWTNDIWKDTKNATRIKDRNISQEYHLLPLTKYTVGVRLRDYTGIKISADKKLDKKIETPKTSAYIENVPVHVQWDDKWGAYALTSGKDMASYGCGDASLSMAMAHWYRQTKNKTSGFAATWNRVTYKAICESTNRAPYKWDTFWKSKCYEYGNEPNPLNVQRWEEITGVASNGAWHPIVMKKKMRELGLDFEPVCTHNMAQINKNYFDRNIPIIAKTRPSINSCGPQHYILLLGFYNNKQFYLNNKEGINYVIANDPAMDHTEATPRWIDIATVMPRTVSYYCGPHEIGNHSDDTDNWSIDALENGAFAVFPRNEEEEKDPNYLQIVSKRSGCSLKFLNRMFYGK